MVLIMTIDCDYDTGNDKINDENDDDDDDDDDDAGRKQCWGWVTWKFVVNALISILFLITNNIIIIIDINASHHQGGLFLWEKSVV